MNLKEAVAVAKQQISDLFAPEIPGNLRQEHFLYDDHLAVWSVTMGFVLRGQPETRRYKIVRVSAADSSVLSVRDP